jgi:hypothetical protein
MPKVRDNMKASKASRPTSILAALDDEQGGE